MNYQTATDQEINERIMIITQNIDESSYSKISGNYHKDMHGNQTCSVQWDYCNSWQHMGPLIEDGKIGVFMSGVESSPWTAMSEFGDFEYDHVSPLRAAAICWLMSKENEG